MEILSLQNSKVKLVALLQTSAKARKENSLFIVEGQKEVNLAFSSGYKAKNIFVCFDYFQKSDYSKLNFETIDTVSKQVYEKMAFRGSTEGILGVFETRELSLASIKLSKNPLILILEKVEKPGNLGAILRTADAIKADAVIICDYQTDFFNPNVIRSSIGCFFSVQLASSKNQECLDWLKENKINYFSASLDAKKFYHQQDYKNATAFVLGTEADGLSEFWQKDKNNLIKIPMLGKIDSLNVSVSAAVLAFEAKRQRDFS